MTTRKSTTCAMLRTQIAHTRFFTDMVGKATRLEDGISVTGGKTLGPAHTTLRLEDGTSVTGGGALGHKHHTLLPGRQYLHNQYVKRVHGKHTCTTRLEDGISITGGEAPGQTHTTLRLEDGTCQYCYLSTNNGYHLFTISTR